MAEITIQEWRDRIEKLGAGEFRRRLNQRLTRAALDTEARAKLNATSRPKVRSGRLRNSIRAFVLDEGRGPSIVLQAGGTSGGAGQVVYARVQEYGATIRAKGDGWLKIPVKGGAALTKAGVHRGSGPPGSYRFVKQVKVPPTYFLRRAMDVTEKELRVELGDLWRVVHEERG